MTWFGLNGEQITSDDAVRLLASLEDRTVALAEIDVSPTTHVTVRTTFTVCGECAPGEVCPETPLWETIIGATEWSVHRHMTREAAEKFHAQTVDGLRGAAARNAIIASEVPDEDAM